MRTDLSEEGVASRGKVGCGIDCQVRSEEGGENSASWLSFISRIRERYLGKVLVVCFCVEETQQDHETRDLYLRVRGAGSL